jgi:hypothetical protein
MSVVPRPRPAEPPAPATAPATLSPRSSAVVVLSVALAALALVAALAGLLVGGGDGRHEALTARGEVVTLFGDGLYAFDSWLVGAGNRGGDVAILVVEVPLLLLALRWYRQGGPVAAVALTGVLSFFTYYYVSMVFATSQNRAFPVYVAAASVAGFALVTAARGLDAGRLGALLPGRPGRAALTSYLVAVAAALTAAWAPGMAATALGGDVAATVGPYTSATTEALDLGLVVPTVVVAAVLLQRRRPAGRLLALVVLVLNCCIGVALLAQGAAQLWYDVPLTVAEIVVKSLTFLALTVVAGCLLARAVGPGRRTSAPGAVEWPHEQ